MDEASKALIDNVLSKDQILDQDITRKPPVIYMSVFT